jgi:hypothetical protein
MRHEQLCSESLVSAKGAAYIGALYDSLLVWLHGQQNLCQDSNGKVEPEICYSYWQL